MTRVYTTKKWLEMVEESLLKIFYLNDWHKIFAKDPYENEINYLKNRSKKFIVVNQAKYNRWIITESWDEIAQLNKELALKISKLKDKQ